MKKVLLLEEDEEGRTALAQILKTRGFTVVQAASDSSALATLWTAYPFDLLIAGATKYDRAVFLSDVREYRPHLPVVFLTDYCSPEARLRGLVFGAFGMSRRLNFYLNMRPITLPELDRLIRIALNGGATNNVFRSAAA